MAFASLYRSFGAPVLLIELSNHVLIGAEMRPGPGEKYVLVDNRYYVIGEVAGPGKRRPGDASHDVWSGDLRPLPVHRGAGLRGGLHSK